MKYRVIGQNRDTGARATLEFEAESKAAAERKATQQGLTVNRVEDITSGEPSRRHVDYTTEHKRRKSMLPRLVFGVIVIAIIVAVMFWDRLRGLVGM
jgi:hypothetical protein